MSGKGSGKVQETEAERALAQVAQQRLQDWRQRWAPVTQRFGEIVNKMAAPDSAERRDLKGQVTADTRAAFSEAQEQAQTRDIQRGAGVSAARIAERGADEARSLGMGIGGADQAVDSAYVQGLQQIAALGRGQATGAVSGMADAASMSARQAQADAQLSADRRAGNAQLAGTAIGMGMKLYDPKAWETQNPAMTSRAPSSFGIQSSPFSGQ